MPKVEMLPNEHPLSKDNAVLDTKTRLERELRILERSKAPLNNEWEETKRNNEIKRLREYILKISVAPISKSELTSAERLTPLLNVTPKDLEVAKEIRKEESKKALVKESGFKKLWGWISGKDKQNDSALSESRKKVKELEEDQQRLAWKLGKTLKEKDGTVLNFRPREATPVKEMGPVENFEDDTTQELEARN